MQRIPHSMQGHTEVVLGNKENHQGLLETGLLWQEDGVVPGSRGRMWLASWILPPLAGRWNLSGWGLGGLQLFWLRATSWVGAFPAGWGAYLERTEELMVRTVGPCEPQRCQGSSTWTFSPYATSFWASCWLKHLNIWPHMLWLNYSTIQPLWLAMYQGGHLCNCSPITDTQWSHVGSMSECVSCVLDYEESGRQREQRRSKWLDSDEFLTGMSSSASCLNPHTLTVNQRGHGWPFPGTQEENKRPHVHQDRGSRCSVIWVQKSIYTNETVL